MRATKATVDVLRKVLSRVQESFSSDVWEMIQSDLDRIRAALPTSEAVEADRARKSSRRKPQAGSSAADPTPDPAPSAPPRPDPATP